MSLETLKKDYLHETIQDCLDNIRPEEASLVTFVVLIAEKQFDQNVNETVIALNNKFETAIENGILQVIMPPSFWYPPDLDFIEPTFNDSQERMVWRTKQNLDYAYLMIYAKYFFGFTDYYIQLEDDVVSKTGYISAMTVFADTNKEWFACDFSKLGFIGKLFYTNHLPLLSNFILLFYREKPVDWILDQLFLVKYCNHEEGGCIKKRINGVRRLYHKPALFQHIGRYSSLSGKVQSLKDSSFKLKTKVAAPIQHSENKKADQLSSNVSLFTLDNLENFYNYSTPLVITFNQTSIDDNHFAVKGTTLLKIKYFNPIEISSIGLRYFVRYRQNVANKLPFKVNICDENYCFDVEFPHILHLKVSFKEFQNVSSITVVLDEIVDIETVSLTSLLIT
uniref:MGAT4 conserved region domain-containing protein n=1 Tax=Panagrolaimus superbus TaxID=310955 RepID=A0A914YZM0_9BILA